MRVNEEGQELLVLADPTGFDVNFNKDTMDVFEDHTKLPRMEYLEITSENTTLSEEQQEMVKN